MFEKLRKLFDDPIDAPQERLLVVEIEPLKRPAPASQEIRDSVLSLRFHPGFQHLLEKFRFQRAVLEAKLRTDKHESLREVDNLQTAASVFNWFDQQIAFELQQSKAREPKPATSHELELFEKVRQSLEEV